MSAWKRPRDSWQRWNRGTGTLFDYVGFIMELELLDATVLTGVVVVEFRPRWSGDSAVVTVPLWMSPLVEMEVNVCSSFSFLTASRARIIRKSIRRKVHWHWSKERNIIDCWSHDWSVGIYINFSRFSGIGPRSNRRKEMVTSSRRNDTVTGCASHCVRIHNSMATV